MFHCPVKNFTMIVAQFPSEVGIDTSLSYATTSHSFTENSRTLRISCRTVQSIKLAGGLSDYARRVCKFGIDDKLRVTNPWYRYFQEFGRTSETINDEWQALSLRSCHFARDLHCCTSVHFYACRLCVASGVCETDDCFERSPSIPKGGRAVSRFVPRNFEEASGSTGCLGWRLEEIGDDRGMTKR